MNSSAPRDVSPPAPQVALSGLSLRKILDLSSNVLCACDLAGRIMWCNRGFEQALGRPSAEALGQLLDDMVHPEDSFVARVVGGSASAEPTRPTEDNGVRRSAGTEQAGIDTRVRRGDEWRWIEWTVRVDRVRGLVYASGRDVTEWRATYDALRAGEQRLHTIIDHAPAAVVVKDLHGRYLLANEEWASVVGRPVEQVVGASDIDCHAGNAEVLAAHERALLAGAPAAVRDATLETPDGPRDFMVTMFLLRDDAGVPYASCSIATDITERSRVQRALAERKRLLDSVLEASPDIISLLDDNGRVHQISSAEQVMLGYRHRQPTDQELFSLVHPDDFDEVASAFIQMVTGASSRVHLRYRVLHLDGHWVTVDSRAQAVMDEGGAFRGAVVVTRDVTERIESELRLETARQAAEHASKAKSDFLSRMSHELRTPLNSILGFSQLLQMDELPMRQVDAVEHILRAGRHLLDIIDEVLDIARIESGHLELHMRPVAVADVVTDAVELTRPMADRGEVAVQVTISEAGLAVNADRQRLLQVLLNLMSNAVKYNRSGGRIDIACEASDGERVRVAVADTGRGIRPEDMGRVFEPFDRLGAEQFGVEGTGVGLSLSRHLVEQMGGNLGVESVPDVGSTFVAELPRAVLPETQSAAPGAQPPGGAAGRSASFRVLLVEQNLASLELVESVLAHRHGVVVLAAMHGRLALDLAREHRPDLVLLDPNLPDMPGSLLLDRLGEDGATAGIPVALLSADLAGNQMRRLMGRNVSGHVAKPIDVRALLSLVDAVRSTRR